MAISLGIYPIFRQTHIYIAYTPLDVWESCAAGLHTSWGSRESCFWFSTAGVLLRTAVFQPSSSKETCWRRCMKQALEQGAFQEGGNGGRVRDSPTLNVLMMMLLVVMMMTTMMMIMIMIMMLQGSHFMASAANLWRRPQVGQEWRQSREAAEIGEALPWDAPMCH